jgi:hypothetical protein
MRALHKKRTPPTAPTQHARTYLSQCPCEHHLKKQLFTGQYALNVDQLFDLIFGSNEFVRQYRLAQQFSGLFVQIVRSIVSTLLFIDTNATEWYVSADRSCRQRQLTYQVPYRAPLVGSIMLLTNEDQVRRQSKRSETRRSSS